MRIPLIEPFNTICRPAQIHLVYLIVYVVVHLFSVPILHSVAATIIGLIWSWIINWVCRRGYRWASWVVLIVLFTVEVPPLLMDIHKMYKQKSLKLKPSIGHPITTDHTAK